MIEKPGRAAADDDVAFRLKGWDLLAGGLWLGLAAGVLEGLWALIRSHVLHANTLLGPGVVWMAPLMDLLWMVIPAVAVALVTWRWPRLARFGLVFVLFPALTLFLLAFDRLHTYAILLLAFGGAIQLARFFTKRPSALRSLVRFGFPILGAYTVAAAAVVDFAPRLAERRALSRLAPAGAGAPNVLLLVLDTVRGLSLSLNGYSVPTTPVLKQVARSGVQFSRAWSPSAWTLSSHASMFTGFFPHQLVHGLSTPLDSAKRTLAEVLRAHGYATGGFVGNVHYVGPQFGLARGFAHYDEYRFSRGELFLNSALGRYLAKRRDFRGWIRFYDIFGRKPARRIDGALLDWIPTVGSRPWFAFVNYFDAHEPYEPPADWERRFASNTPRKLYLTDQSIRGARRLFKQDMTEAEIARERQAYEASIAWLDDEIGRLLDELEARGALKNTLVIITSDHGEQFGEHGLFVHGNSIYRPLIWVPFITVFPGHVPAGRTVEQPVSLRNLPATVLDLVGLGSQSDLPGESLRRYWSEGAASPEPLFAETVSTWQREVWRALLADSLWYIRHEMADSVAEELYDARRDPDQVVNLADSSTHRSDLTRLRGSMDSILTVTGPDVWVR